MGGLSWETKEPQLKDYFEKFGSVESVNLKVNAVTGKSRCFAFVVFKEASDLTKVFDSGDHAINSKKVDVKRAKAKPGKIFIGGLKPELTDEEIRKYFEQYGAILEFEMPIDKVKNQRKTFGFITFEREETMKELIKKNKVTIGDVEIDLRKATPKNDFRNGRFYNDFVGFTPGSGYDYYGGYYYNYAMSSSTDSTTKTTTTTTTTSNGSVGGGKMKTGTTSTTTVVAGGGGKRPAPY